VFYYNDCTPEQVNWAYGQVRPQSLQPLVTADTTHTGFGIIDIPRDYILCLNDRNQAVLTVVEHQLYQTRGRRRSIRSGPPILL